MPARAAPPPRGSATGRGGAPQSLGNVAVSSGKRTEAMRPGSEPRKGGWLLVPPGAPLGTASTSVRGRGLPGWPLWPRLPLTSRFQLSSCIWDEARAGPSYPDSPRGPCAHPRRGWPCRCRGQQGLGGEGTCRSGLAAGGVQGAHHLLWGCPGVPGWGLLTLSPTPWSMV